MKLCKKCNIEKSLEYFYFRKDSNTYRNECTKCIVKLNKANRQKNKNKTNSKNREYYQVIKESENYKNTRNNYYKNNKDKTRNNFYKRKYGITLEKYDEMLELQNHVCYICKTKENKLLHVDHCHITNKVRFLLCSQCNMALGAVKENISILNKLIEYIKYWTNEKEK